MQGHKPNQEHRAYTGKPIDPSNFTGWSREGYWLNGELLPKWKHQAMYADRKVHRPKLKADAVTKPRGTDAASKPKTAQEGLGAIQTIEATYPIPTLDGFNLSRHQERRVESLKLLEMLREMVG